MKKKVIITAGALIVGLAITIPLSRRCKKINAPINSHKSGINIKEKDAETTIKHTKTNTETDQKTCAVIEITRKNIEKEVYQSKLPVVLDVYSSICPPCQKLSPIIEELSNECHNTYKFAKLNIDKEFNLGNQYKVRSLPTILFIKDNQVKGKITGFHTKEDIKENLTTFFG